MRSFSFPLAAAACAVGLTGLIGCDGGSGPGGSGGQDGEGGAGGQPDNTPHLNIAGDYTLQPGEERYLCYTTRAPQDLEIALTKLIPDHGEGTHHIFVAQTLVPEPEGMSDCNVLIKSTWLPLYAAGVKGDPLTMPEGSGLQIVNKGQQILMQLHLQNPTSKPISARTSMRLNYVEAASLSKLAGIFGLDHRAISLPPNTDNVKSQMDCPASKDMDVFAIFPHMHKYGKKLVLSRGAKAGDEVLFDHEWLFDQQPIVAKQMSIKANERIFLECEHRNDTSATIGWGESSDTEMCSAVMYYTPFDQLGGCIKAAP